MKKYVKKMPYDELIKEHENLVAVLEKAVQFSPLPALRELLDEQSAELKQYKKEYQQLKNK